MKKNTPPAPATSGSTRAWRTIAVVSLVANVALGAWWLHGRSSDAAADASRQPAPVSTATAKPVGPYAALGSYLAENNRIADLGWTPAQFESFLQGIRANYEGRGLPLDEDAKKLRDDISQRVQAMLAKEQPDPAEDYFRTLREKEGVSRTPSGLHYRITEQGSGPNAKATDTVVLSFAARLPDGRNLPELSRARVRIAVKDLLPGLAEGVQLLSVGGKALVYLPPKLAFSEADWPANIPHGMPIGFFVELHEIVEAKHR